MCSVQVHPLPRVARAYHGHRPDDAFRAIMSYSAREAVFLANNGFDNILVAYPVSSEVSADVTSALRTGKSITLVPSVPRTAACDVLDRGQLKDLTKRGRSAKLSALTGAGVTQLVECQLPKLEVAGSNPVSRSKP